MFIESIEIENCLSFGKSQGAIPLRNLNVIIGANASGKSNFLEVIRLLASLPKDFERLFMRSDSGLEDWLYKGKNESECAKINVTFQHSCFYRALDYQLVLHQMGFIEERLKQIDRQNDSYLIFDRGHLIDREGLETKIENLKSFQSVFLHISDRFPGLTTPIFPMFVLAEELQKIAFYQNWHFGRQMPARSSQPADMPNIHLEPDCSNLGLVLNHLQGDLPTKKRLLAALQDVYNGIDDFHVQIEANRVQIFLYEDGVKIPATRLSDGTLRYLCLLAILCHPKPPPLICIEEPELGLHPDVLPSLSDLLKEASERTQIIITTHSEILIDAMSEQPESVVIAEKGENGTVLTRLDAEKLKPWLAEFQLGQLWSSGQLGGSRW